MRAWLAGTLNTVVHWLTDEHCPYCGVSIPRADATCAKRLCKQQQVFRVDAW